MALVDCCLKKRDRSIDLLRFIALTGIVIVYIHPSEFWTQLRNFDVPLMVFLSGVSLCPIFLEESTGRVLFLIINK